MESGQTERTPVAPPETTGDGLAAGQTVGGGRFRLQVLIGRGGMGAVWLADDLRLGDKLALKFLLPEISHDPAAFDAMRREALKSRKLTHPNIVRLHDFHEADGEPPFISMEYVRGETLATLRLKQPDKVFNWEFLAPLLRQICEALQYAQREKIIHRDLKPANLMLDDTGRLKLADFGIAATFSESMSRISMTHLTSGTRAYMSPQQMDGNYPHPTDDLYALGATLYELLTGRPPFHSGDVAYQARHLSPKPLEERLAEDGVQNPIPAEVSVVIMACLAKEPARRPQSARAVAEAFGLLLDSTADAPNCFHGPGGTSRTGFARWRAAVMVGVGILILMLAISEWVFRQQPNHPGPVTTTVAIQPAKPPPLGKFLTGTKWLWHGKPDSVLEFLADGTVKFDEWDSKGLVTGWREVGAYEVRLTILSGRTNNLHANLVFAEDRESFTGTDFNPRRAVARSPRAR